MAVSQKREPAMRGWFVFSPIQILSRAIAAKKMLQNERGILRGPALIFMPVSSEDPGIATSSHWTDEWNQAAARCLKRSITRRGPVSIGILPQITITSKARAHEDVLDNGPSSHFHMKFLWLG